MRMRVMLAGWPEAGALGFGSSVATDVPAPKGSSRRIRPPVPVIVVLVSIVVAFGAVSALIFVLFKSTTGPGQTLRAYYEAVAADDCGTAYGYLSNTMRDRVGADDFCRSVLDAHQHGLIPANVAIKSVTGFGEPPAQYADVVVQELGPAANRGSVHWKMIREGDSWRVSSFLNTRCVRKRGSSPALRSQACAPPLG